MGDIGLNEAGRYLIIAASALYVPTIVSKIPTLVTALNKIPFFTHNLWGITIGTIILAGLGALIIDNIVYK